jgi:hypothetical protein
VDGPAVVEADLATAHPGCDRGRIEPLGDQRGVECCAVLGEEVQARDVPLVTARQERDRAVDLVDIVEADPGGEHVVRRTRLPVLPVGVPPDPGRAARPVDRLPEELVVPQPDPVRPGQRRGGRADRRVPDQGRQLVDPERGVVVLPEYVAIGRLPAAGRRQVGERVVVVACVEALHAALGRVEYVGLQDHR